MAVKGLVYLVCTAFVFAPYQGIAWADSGADHQVAQSGTIELGTSGGNILDSSKRFCCSGTLGSLLEDALSGQQYILSNNHVLARANQGIPGELVNHPGMIDQNCQTNGVIAELFTFAPITMGSRKNPGGPNLVDAAIALVTSPNVATNGSIIDIGPVNSVTVSPSSALNMLVQKSGRTTGNTHGVVTAINVQVNVGYSAECGGRITDVATFVDQLMITDGSFSAGGDSGSLIVEDIEPYPTLPRPVGLLFAGSSSSTIANPIDNVLSALSAEAGATLTMVGGVATPPPPSGSISGVVVADSDGSPIEGAVVDVDSGQSGISDIDGFYIIGGIPVGDHDVTASASGFEASAATVASVFADTETLGVDFSLIEASAPTGVVVQCVNYSTAGGKNQDRNLRVTIRVADDFGAPAVGAAVDISIDLDGSLFGTGTGGITNEVGEVTFSARNAPNGVYDTTVTDVRLGGLAFGGAFPANSFEKVPGGGSADFCIAGASSSISNALTRAVKVKANHSARLMSIPGVVGHGVGLSASGEAEIQVYVVNAAAGTAVPSHVDNLPVRVVVTGEFVAF